MKGTIFDIQRFSVHDGPGIRTTVFMKGCPLRCKWCHNPEGINPSRQLQYFSDKCIGCHRCGSRSSFSDAEKCPSEALKICGKEVSEDDVLDVVLRDRIYYSDNGGITFSGGECLMQADFVASVLSKANAYGLHTAIDTSGYARWSEIEKTIDYCDLYLYDIKCADPILHKVYTGVDNTVILENLKKLSLLNKNIWVRVPVISGFNNRIEEMSDIADIVSALPSVSQVTLMPYHTLGVSKYETLGMQYQYDSEKKILTDELEDLAKLFLDRGIPLV